MKPFSEASDRNRQPILGVIDKLFVEVGTVLEIGSGTGQHAVFFARNLPHLFWQCSDQVQHHPGIVKWLESENLDNVGYPLALDVTQSTWPEIEADAVFSANTAHIMPWHTVIRMFEGVGVILPHGGIFVLYGPFNRNGRFTSASNERFHHSLVSQDPAMGIRDDQNLINLGISAGLHLDDDIAMPSNNRILIWRK